MKNEVKVTFYLKRNEEKEDGTCPVMARLTVWNTESVFSAKLNVSAEIWASGRVKGKSQTAGEINRRLDEIRASALSHHRELSAVKACPELRLNREAHRSFPVRLSVYCYSP